MLEVAKKSSKDCVQTEDLSVVVVCPCSENVIFAKTVLQPSIRMNVTYAQISSIFQHQGPRSASSVKITKLESFAKNAVLDFVDVCVCHAQSIRAKSVGHGMGNQRSFRCVVVIVNQNCE